MIAPVGNHVLSNFASISWTNQNRAVEGSPKEEASESAAQKMMEAQKKAGPTATPAGNDVVTMAATGLQGSMAAGSIINALV
ncbi:hypothetical protein [Neomoorella thermoacetica]|uniref:hypothetical protein n=1 Tax=Neomoorella thermoacetica TaxID=1525 RepID=UPI0008FB561E|nr:hypothetical protein [Moorella thermoacetica]APC08682.1 hypothetical protein MTJW_15230 [Moorella thermoacetica]